MCRFAAPRRCCRRSCSAESNSAATSFRASCSTCELGFPNLDLRGWNGFFAPKGTPEPVIARLQQEIAAAAKHSDLQKRMTDVGAEPSGSSQAEMREMLREQIAKVRPMVEELKLVMQ